MGRRLSLWAEGKCGVKVWYWLVERRYREVEV